MIFIQGTFSKRRLLYLRMIDGISLKIVNCYKAYLPLSRTLPLVYMYIICLLPKWIARFFYPLLNYIVKNKVIPKNNTLLLVWAKSSTHL